MDVRARLLRPDMSRPGEHGGLHFVWDHAPGLSEPWRCWCGEDHPDDNGKVGADKYISPDDPGWVAADDPRAVAALDDLYLEAWLGGEGQP
jgi:hypothetical protein